MSSGVHASSAISRVIAYVDGFNLYFGMRSQGLGHCYWLDVPGALQRLLIPRQSLVTVKYFTSRITEPPDKVQRQSLYLEALATLPTVRIYYGKYQQSMRRCDACSAEWPVFQEKMTDVNIAVELMTDVFTDRLDVAFVVSADSDLVPPVAAIRSLFPLKRVVSVFPPGRGSIELERTCHAKLRLRRGLLEQSQMPETVVGPTGFPISRPADWR